MNKPRVAIIDYKMGNMFSVKNAFEKIGVMAEITDDVNYIINADALVLPGVGAFRSAMKHLEENNLVDIIKAFIETGKPFIGICLGLQLLFDESEEFGSTKGIGIIRGKVQRFPDEINGRKIKVPQIEWNQIKRKSIDWKDTELKNIIEGEYMYFVHSYYVIPEDDSIILTTSNYEGIEYCSAIKKDNIVAFQFHPEKSGHKGLQIYENIKEIIIKSKGEVNV